MNPAQFFMVFITAVVLIGAALIGAVYVSMQNTKAKTDAQNFRQEQITKRSAERHDLLDVLNKIKRTKND